MNCERCGKNLALDGVVRVSDVDGETIVGFVSSWQTSVRKKPRIW
jgi:hypothetical protein